MKYDQFYFYENACHQMSEVPGIRFAGMVNKQGRKIVGGFSPSIDPLEKDVQKIEMLMMEISLDLSMRKEFDCSLGNICAIVSYREKANIITIPHKDDLMLLSTEPELDIHKVIQIAQNSLNSNKIIEVKTP